MTDVPINLHDAPLEAFTSFFIFPFCFDPEIPAVRDWTPGEGWESKPFKIPMKEGDLSDEFSIQRNYMEYIYFHDYVRSFLFTLPSENEMEKDKKGDMEGKKGCLKRRDEEPERLGYYEYKLKKPSVAILETIGSKKMFASVAGIYMHVYPGHLGFLIIEVEQPEPTANVAGLVPEDAMPVSTGADLLLFNQMFRRIYPAYFEENNFNEQVNSQEFPISITLRGEDDHSIFTLNFEDMPKTYLKCAFNDKRYPHFPSHISPLIEKFLNMNGQNNKSDNQSYFSVLDDRMLVLSYAAFPNFIPDEIKKKWLDIYFSQFLYVDNPNDKYRYEPEFTENLVKEHSYGRWTHWGTRTGFSRYSGALLYFGHWPYLYRPVVSMYYQMFLLCLYYRSRLVRFSDQITDVVRRFPPGSLSDPKCLRDFADQIRQLHSDFMRFVNLYWFTEVTHQDQGIELFKIMRKSFELDPMYAQVKDELERADELVEMLYRKGVDEFNRKATILAPLIGGAAVLVGIFGMNFCFFGEEGVGNNFWILVLVIIFACSWGMLPLWWWSHKKWKRRTAKKSHKK